MSESKNTLNSTDETDAEFGLGKAPDWVGYSLDAIVSWTSGAISQATGSKFAEKFNTSVSMVISSVDLFDAAAHGTWKDVTIQTGGVIGGVVGGVLVGFAGFLGSSRATKNPYTILGVSYASSAWGANKGEELVEDGIKGIFHFVEDKNKNNFNFFDNISLNIAKRINPINNIIYNIGQCFPSSTLVKIKSNENKLISEIKIGDTVLAFDPLAASGRSTLVPRRVTRIFHNVTTEWLRLTWVENGETQELVCTPGHHFLDRFGKFPQIEDMLDAGRATVVLASGELAEVTAERIVYSSETAHLFEQATVAGISAGGAALKPVAVEGWQTYNFEVEELHTYVAGGIRVHNISAPWAHEEWKAEQTTQRLLNIGSVPADYAKKLGDATRGVDEDKRSGNLVGFTSAGRAIALNREVYTSFIAEHGGKYATGSTHAEGAARAAISNGASRKQALALAYKEAENRGVNTMNAGFSARIDRAASIPQTVSSGSSGKSGGGEQKAQPAPKSSGRGSSGKPVLLDLDGNGLKVDTLDVSSTFVDLEGDGYQHRTAWAGAGDGVLVLDADHNGVISRKNEFVFTEWDSTAGTDFDALRQVFDTNRNGKLDAGDARWADFKVMVGGRMVTLAALGIQSIDLIATGSGQTFADGSAIEGTSVFTRTDGTTGTAGDAKLAIDETGYVLGRTAVTHADGSVTRDIKGHGTDGSLSFRNVVTVSADGVTTTTQFDDDGNGVFDRSQIIQRTVNGDGSMLETVSNVRTDGSLRDKVTTATSADHKAITTSADQDGDAIADQIQTFTANADGSTATRVKAVAVNGALLKEVLTTSSADGLTKTIQTDSAGRGIYEKTRTETTVVNGDGSRTETVTERRADNALLSRTLTTTNATNTQRIIDTDHTGNGQYDLKETETTTIAGNGDIVATSEARNRDATLRGRTVTTTTADGLSTTVQSDLTGDAVFDRVTASVTVVEAGGTRTTTETSKSGNGTLLSKTVDSTSGDGKTILENVDANGDGVFDRTSSILIDAAGATAATVSDFAPNGVLVTRRVTNTAADGLSYTTKVDVDGNNVYDTTQSYAVTGNADNSRTETETLVARNGALINKTATTTSENGLTTTVRKDITGDGVYDTSATDVIVLGSDGSRTTTLTEKNGNDTLAARTTTIVSADRKTTTVSRDVNGDAKTDVTEIGSVAATGVRTVTTSQYNANGSLKARDQVTTSASTLSVTTKTDVTGDGVYDGSVTDVTTINGDSSVTRIVSNLAANNALLSKTHVGRTANGLSAVDRQDRDGNNVFEIVVNDATVINADGSRSQTITKTAQDASVIEKSTTWVSANGLTTSRQVDQNGDGVYDGKLTDIRTLAAGGSETRTESRLTVANALLAKTTTTVSADRRTVTKSVDLDGNAVNDAVETTQVNADGSKTITTSTYKSGGHLASKTVSVTSANGLTGSVLTDLDGDGVNELQVTDATTVNADGSRTKTIGEADAAGTSKSRTITGTSANGLVVDTTWEAAGAGSTTRKETVTTVINADGSRSETTVNLKAGAVLNDKTVETISADKLTTTTSVDQDGDTVNDKIVSRVVQSDGSIVETSTDYNASATVTGRTVVTTSANGLSVTTTHVPLALVGSNRFDWSSTDVTVINTDGSRVRTICEFNVTYTPSQVSTLRNKAIITTSGNGLSRTTQWDLTGAGAIGKHETDVTTLNADGSEARTVTTFVAGAMTTQLVNAVSANGLVKTSNWTTVTPAGNQTQVSTDTTVVNADGTRTQTVIARKPDASLLSKSVTVFSADGRTLNAQTDTTGANAYDLVGTVQTDALADGGSKITSTQKNADGSIRDRTVTIANGNGREVTVSRDLAGDGIVEQTEVRRKAVDGSTTEVITNVRANGQIADTTTVSKSFDGRTATTFWDYDGDTVTDHRRVLVLRQNADGSESQEISEYNAANALKSKTTLATSADDRTTILTRDEDGDTIVDHTETMIRDVSGGQVTTTISTGAALLAKPSTGAVEWAAKPAAKTVVTVSADGKSRRLQADDDGNGTLERTENTLVNSDGSSITTIEVVDAGGTVTAKGTLNVDSTGNVVTLQKDNDNNGTVDHSQTATRRIDGSIVRTAIDRNADGSLKQTLTETINANGKIVLQTVKDGLGRKTEETVLATNGVTTITTLSGPSGQALSIARHSKDSVISNATLYDPLGEHAWARVEQTYDAAGKKTLELQFMDDGTSVRSEYDVNNTVSWARNDRVLDKANLLTSNQYEYDDGTLGNYFYDAASGQLTSFSSFYSSKHLARSYLYDPLDTSDWSFIDQHHDSLGRLTFESRVMDDATRIDTDFEATTRKEQQSRFFSTTGQMTSYANFVYNDNPSAPWNMAINYYDTANRLTSQTLNFPNGEKVSTFWDAASNQNWSTMVETYTPGGQVREQTIHYDDGGRFVSETDYYQQHSWVSYFSTYASNGELVQKITYSDVSGAYELTTGDPTNQYSWRTINQSYVNGQLQFTDIYHDDGIYERRYPEDNSLSRGQVDDAGGSDMVASDGEEQTTTSDEGIVTVIGDEAAWIDTEYGLLVFDPDATGAALDDLITQAKEAAFASWRTNSVTNFESYLEGLRSSFGSDQGRTVDNSDVHAIESRIWQALNQTSIDGAAELRRLSEAGIRLLNDTLTDAAGVSNQQRARDGSRIDLEAQRLAFDSNHDNRLDEQDARWSEFRIWQDANQNGISDAGELKTMSEAGIRLIQLLPQSDAQLLSDGMALTATSCYDIPNAAQFLAADTRMGSGQERM